MYEPNNNNNKTHDQVQHDSFHNDNRSDSMYSDYSSDDHSYYETREIQNQGITDKSNYWKQPTTITDLDVRKGRFHIIVEPSLCMAFGSCTKSLCNRKEQKNKP